MIAKFTSGKESADQALLSYFSCKYNFFLSFFFGNNIEIEPNPVSDIEAISIGPTSVTLTWKNNDSAASRYEYEVKDTTQSRQWTSGENKRGIDISNLSPATSYTFSITPKINGTWGNASFITVATSKMMSSQP